MKSALGLGLLLAVFGFVPLLGGPRYEAALVAGLLGPSWCAVACSLLTWKKLTSLCMSSGSDSQLRVATWASILSQSVSLGVAHVMIMLVVATAHGLREGYCEPALGYGILALGPGAGMLLASFVGSVCAFIVAAVLGPWGRGRKLLVASLALAFPLGSAALEVAHFYVSPSVYAYDAFVGYFAGPLYDTVEYDLERLLSFRAGTFLLLAAIATLLSPVGLVFEGSKRRLHIAPITGEKLSLLVFGGACALGSLVVTSLGEDLAHESSARSIREALGRSTKNGRCLVHFSPGVDAKAAKKLAAECVGHLTQIERYFESESLEDVTIYLFAHSEEKRLLMGAADTYIAKPWRREIYLQPGGFPHQVLGHELAHVVTGTFGAGPLKIAGHIAGLLPDPGRIEGFAEAASPREDSEGTLHQWTAAMKRLELLPALQDLFRLNFLGASPANAYSASGSFVDFIRNNHGADILRRWYRGEDLPSLTSKSWHDLEGQWHAFLDATEVPEDVLEIARPRFSRPGVFERRCPHAVDRKIESARHYCPLQEKRAMRLSEEAIALDPTQIDLEIWMARCAWYSGDPVRARNGLTKMAANEALYEPEARRGALDMAGNIAWNQEDLAQAARLFEAAQRMTYRRDARRQLEVKLWALRQPPAVRLALRKLLAQSPNDEGTGFIELTKWAASENEEDFATYLLARVMMSEGADAQARKYLDDVEIEKLPLESLRREARRMMVLTACLSAMRGADDGPLESARIAYEKLDLSLAERRELTRLAERCTIVGAQGSGP